LVHRLPEALADDHQANVITLFRQFRESFDAVVQALVFADESEEEEDVFPQVVLCLPSFLVEVGSGLKRV
jgi:hypothetical protein